MKFTPRNYPKSYGSVKVGDFRLKEYLNLNNEELDKIQHELAEFCFIYSDKISPIKQFKNYKYLASGWEWSVFQKNDKTVIKIPAGIFSEVNDPLYLSNSQESYQIFLSSYPYNFIAKSNFYREDGVNIIEQEYIKGTSEYILNMNKSDKKLLGNFKVFLLSTLDLSNKNGWLPDYWFQEKENGVLIRNVILEDNTLLFKIIDFTQYFDPSRMYPDLTKKVLKNQNMKIKHLLNLVERKLNNNDKNVSI